MAWSLLTPAVRAVLSAAEAQRNEPGINQVDNCGPADVSCLMQIHGYSDIEPQDLVGPYYRGGTTGPQLNAIIAKRYPNPPAMAYVSSSNPIGDIATWASKGWLSMGLFWSDGAAVVKPYNTGIGHWCIPVADDGSIVTIWNPEWATFDRLSHATFLAASWRQFDVCQRPIPQEEAMTQSDAEAIVRLAFYAGQGKEPTSQQLADRSAEVLKDGAATAVQQILDAKESQDYHTQLQRTPAAAAAPDLSGYATVGHGHDVTGKAK